MELSVIAELIGAFAALIAVALTVIELIFRNSTRKSDIAIEIYAEYLFIVQQIEYGVTNFRTLVTKFPNLNTAEINTYSKIHTIPRDFFDSIHDFEKIGICNTNYQKGGKDNSKLFIDFLGESSQMMNLLNSFYGIILDSDRLSQEALDQYSLMIDCGFELWQSKKISVGALLLSRLPRPSKPKLKYWMWILSAALLITALVIIIVIYSNK
ncbi:MAG: hypothetical protein J6S71_06155 [Clostridia bacterium]|nr:hypothetical protein [Clostridia bacterium]